ncbi:MAG: hypothetical protein ACR2NZ_05160 [Rubripirellula sp.]
MRSLWILAAILVAPDLSSTTSAEDEFRIQISRPRTRAEVGDRWKFDDYRYRLDSRRRDALALRREYNASKGPHVYRTAIVVPMPITPVIGIEAGWVRQPPIVSRVRRTTWIRTPTLVERFLGTYGD